MLERNASFIRRYIPIIINDLSSEDFVYGKATDKNSILEEKLGDVLKDEEKLVSDGFQANDEVEELEVDGQGREELEEKQSIRKSQMQEIEKRPKRIKKKNLFDNRVLKYKIIKLIYKI